MQGQQQQNEETGARRVSSLRLLFWGGALEPKLGNIGANLFFGFRPNSTTLAKPINQLSVVGAEDADAMSRQTSLGHERL